MKTMRPRFSLRTLLILTALAAAACYWFVAPTLTARQFIAAMNRDDFGKALAMCSGEKKQEFSSALDDHSSRVATGSARMLPPTWRELWRRSRRLEVRLSRIRHGAPAYVLGGSGVEIYFRCTSNRIEPIFIWYYSAS
jgi:hypothetical protein